MLTVGNDAAGVERMLEEGVWVPKSVSTLCDLGVFVDQAAKPVPP